jgi:hypothetical protein
MKPLGVRTLTFDSMPVSVTLKAEAKVSVTLRGITEEDRSCGGGLTRGRDHCMILGSLKLSLKP